MRFASETGDGAQTLGDRYGAFAGETIGSGLARNPQTAVRSMNSEKLRLVASSSVSTQVRRTEGRGDKTRCWNRRRDRSPDCPHNMVEFSA